VVTADGTVLHANPDSHPDLFWALRGGGGNFGGDTEFEYRLHPVGPVPFNDDHRAFRRGSDRGTAEGRRRPTRGRDITITAPAPPATPADLSPTRLHLMRAGYLLMGVGLALVKWPLLPDAATLPLYEGVTLCLLTAMSLLAILGLRYPVKLPSARSELPGHRGQPPG
jgi:hypothetical protein